jgi:ATP-binding cassette subfamily C protein LapB
MHLLQLVDRIIIIDQGKIVANDKKDIVLAQLEAGKFNAAKGAES